MKRVTIRVPATTANLGPGFDAFGCALSLYTDVTFEETECGLEITGCPEEFTGPDNLAYVSYCAALATMSEELRGVKIHIDAHIPVCRGLGSSAALLVAGAMGANVLRGNKLSTQGLLNITNAMEGHPDNLAPAFYGGLTASMVDNGLPVCVNFPLHPDWEFLALIPDFNLATSKARAVLPEQVNRADAIYNISHGALVLKALELGDEKLLRTAMQDKLFPAQARPCCASPRTKSWKKNWQRSWMPLRKPTGRCCPCTSNSRAQGSSHRNKTTRHAEISACRSFSLRKQQKCDILLLSLDIFSNFSLSFY